MVVFELASLPTGDGLRVASMGSCRVHGPLAALADRGDLRICAMRRLFSYTASEALQTLELIAGDKVISQVLHPYLYGPNTPLEPKPFRLAMSGGVDVFIVEISHDRQFSYGDVFLQTTFLSNQLVRPHGSALLTWFRELSNDRAGDGVDVQEAIEALGRGGFVCDERMEGLLRGIRFRRQSGETIERALSAMMSRAGGRWIVVGPVVLADHGGATMTDRRALSAKLKVAAEHCGAAFHDPSPLVADHGRVTALDGGGADTSEYAPAFRAIVGETLVDQVRQQAPSRAGRSSAWPRQASLHADFSSRAALVERLNAELVTLHRERSARLGAEASGLYDYYEALFERYPLLGPRERAALEVIEAYLPDYEAYGVVRAGLGEVGLMLAARGRQVIAYEPNANRRSAIEAGHQHLRDAGLVGSGSLTVIASLTPAAPLPGPALGVGLKVGLAPNDPPARAELHRMAAFEALLIEPSTFFRSHSGGEVAPPLDEALARIGFDKRRDYPADSLAWFHR